jgi:hypothetical protein
MFELFIESHTGGLAPEVVFAAISIVGCSSLLVPTLSGAFEGRGDVFVDLVDASTTASTTEAASLLVVKT